MRRKFVSEHFREPDLRRFRRPRAGGQEWWVQSHDPSLSAHIDDAATALSDHHRYNALANTKLREEIDRHALDEFLIGHFEKRVVGPCPGIVDEDIDAAQLVADYARNHLDLFNFSHVQRVRFDFCLGGPHNVARRIGEHRLPSRTDENFHALARERACGLEAYPFTSAS